ncbi:MAG: ribonuclease R, partial [Verrucomicrobia bacterium]|nr:ribonuclease R [Verrucomicrobiota bacterium]
MAEFRPTVEQLIRDYLAGEDYTPLKQHELAKALHIKGSARRDFRNTLYQLERSGQVIRLRKNRWAIPDQSQQVTGFLEVNSKGFGFVRPLAADSEDIFIPGDSMGLAIHGDKVIVSVTRSHAEKRRRRRPDAPPLKEGRVVGVVERSREQLAGILMRSQFYWYVIPDDHRIMHEVRIADAGTLKPEECERHKVVVRLLSPGTGSRFLEGVLTEDLGPADSPGIEILSLMRNYGLTDSFPAAVESAALSVETEPGQTGLDGRVDLRGMLTFTIDPEDAKDFDDAVSLERSPSGEWILWVHIADVAHFVPVGSSIDEEAFNRGTSVYLVDRVISMLPRHLTRDVCSLQPEKDRLTRTVEIRLSSEGDVLEEKTYLSVIRSRQRLTYDEVQLLFDQRACDNVEADIQTSLAQMRLLAAQLRRQRMNNGAITFDLAEVKCLLDSSGKPTAIVRRGAREAYNLIEEFMLLANQAVARMLSSGDRPGIYRIHPPPDEKDWEEMSSDLTKLGISAQPENQHDM